MAVSDGSTPLSQARLGQTVESGHVDTVIVAFTDPQGRLQGSRVHARHFLKHVLEQGMTVPRDLLAVDLDMRPVPEALAGWDREAAAGRGDRGDILLRPDLGTLRAAPWLPGTAMIQCDLEWESGDPVLESPRQILRQQLAAADTLGVTPVAGTELDFQVFETTYQAAWEANYHGLRPAGRYDVNHSIIGTSGIEPMLRDLRNSAYNAGLSVELSRGAGPHGQQQLVFGHGNPLRTADEHVVFKTAAKELAIRHERAVTFMARFDEGTGNGCRLHLSLPGFDTVPAPADEWAPDDGGEEISVFNSFVAGVLATLDDFMLFYAPTANSYRRFQPEASAPTLIAWGNRDPRCALRVLSAGSSLVLENRLPGSDSNPYLTLAAMLAGGLFGVRGGLPLGQALDDPDRVSQEQPQRVPGSLRDARDRFRDSDVGAFDDVIQHYTALATAELDGPGGAGSESRAFERL